MLCRLAHRVCIHVVNQSYALSSSRSQVVMHGRSCLLCRAGSELHNSSKSVNFDYHNIAYRIRASKLQAEDQDGPSRTAGDIEWAELSET